MIERLSNYGTYTYLSTHSKGTSYYSILTLSAAVDPSPVLPPPNALSSYSPVLSGDTAVAADVLDVVSTALMVGTTGHRSGLGPESLAPVEVLLVFLENLMIREKVRTHLFIEDQKDGTYSSVYC